MSICNNFVYCKKRLIIINVIKMSYKSVSLCYQGINLYLIFLIKNSRKEMTSDDKGAYKIN